MYDYYVDWRKTLVEKFRIQGGETLKGEVSIGGAKNSVLKLLAASIFVKGCTKKYNLPTGVRLDNVVTVVDACRLVDEFASGKDLINKNIDEEDIENLIIEQIEFCTKIIINKASDVTKEELVVLREGPISLDRILFSLKGEC